MGQAALLVATTCSPVESVETFGLAVNVAMLFAQIGMPSASSTRNPQAPPF